MENNNRGIRLRLKENPDKTYIEETGGPVLGYKNITLLFNLGASQGEGGNQILVEMDGNLDILFSNDLIHDLPAYELLRGND